MVEIEEKETRSYDQPRENNGEIRCNIEEINETESQKEKTNESQKEKEVSQATIQRSRSPRSTHRAHANR